MVKMMMMMPRKVHEDEMVNSLDQVITRIKATLQAIDQKLQKEKGQRLEALLNRVVKDMLLKGSGDDKCPPGLVDYVFAPRSPMAQRVIKTCAKRIQRSPILLSAKK
jgi:uncharacterized protein (DUF2267 family)